jgi:hypothetical protein
VSVNLRNRRNVVLLVALVVATIVAILGGTAWLRGQGQNLVVEVGYASLVIILALVIYDSVLVQ